MMGLEVVTPNSCAILGVYVKTFRDVYIFIYMLHVDHVTYKNIAVGILVHNSRIWILAWSWHNIIHLDSSLIHEKLNGTLPTDP